jgi:hypothetical protein
MLAIVDNGSSPADDDRRRTRTALTGHIGIERVSNGRSEVELQNMLATRRKIVDWGAAQIKAANTARWAVTMAKVRIRRVATGTRWQLVTFCGKVGGESIGVIDMMAVRKDHGTPMGGAKRGDNFQIILIQVKGGSAAMPTKSDAIRLRAVARRHRASHVLLASWKKGKAVQFFELRRGSQVWQRVSQLESVFA